MKKFTSSMEFITGVFSGFIFTGIFFTFVLTLCYTPNNLLEHSGFYKNGKLYKVVESSQVKRCRKYETGNLTKNQ